MQLTINFITDSRSVTVTIFSCRIEGQEQTINPIDLATGQFSGQHETTVEINPSYSEMMSNSKISVRDVLKKPSDNPTRTQSFLTTKSKEQLTITSISPPSTIRPRSHAHEKLTEKNDIYCQEPNYDVIETVLEQSSRWQVPVKQEYISEARMSGPDYEVTSSSLSTYSKDNDDQYDVLVSGMESNLQKGTIQEDLSSPNEDKYYSMAREHRLVPVGRRLSQNNNDHLYEALSEEDTKIQQGSSDYSSLTNLEKQKTDVVRFQSTTRCTIEELDPVYEEPFVNEPAKDISSKSLFDDLKYACKEDCDQKVILQNNEEKM